MTSKLDNLIIEPTTRRELNEYLAKPAHSLMLVGVSGVGLGTIAQALGHAIAGGSTIFLTPTTHKQQKTSIINADDIADLIRVTRDKRDEPLVIIIDDADRTAPGVFERLLKLIEEPVPNIYYIITTHNLPAIPATIMSRSSVIRLKLPTEAQCTSLLSGLDAKKRAQIKFLAPNRPAEIRRLLGDNKLFTAVASTTTLARQFVTKGLPERLAIIDKNKDRDSAIQLCQSISTMLLAASRRSTRDAQNLADQLSLVNDVALRLQSNCNIKAQLLFLALNF